MGRTPESANGPQALTAKQWDPLRAEQPAEPHYAGWMEAEVLGQRAKARSFVSALPCSCPFPLAPHPLPQSLIVYGTSRFLGMKFEKHGFKGMNITWDRFPSSASQNIKGELWFHILVLLPFAFSWGLIQCPPCSTKCQWVLGKALYIQDNGHQSAV